VFQPGVEAALSRSGKINRIEMSSSGRPPQEFDQLLIIGSGANLFQTLFKIGGVDKDGDSLILGFGHDVIRMIGSGSDSFAGGSS